MSDAANHLALTERGAAWVAQFENGDRELARRLLESLTLVSHNAFERSLTELIEREAADAEGPVALFATREWNPSEPFFPTDGLELDAVAAGADLGSEARIAALIRNLTRAEPGRYLNHPTIEQMRGARCRALFVVDDFIGSGERTSEFLQAMWLSETLRSWASLHLITFKAIAYSAIAAGQERVERAKCRPQVHLERDCPTFTDMPWAASARKEMLTLIGKYGRRTSVAPYAMGYGLVAAALVFEHGCPDNCPAILWAPDTPRQPWQPLFPMRSVLAAEASAFPPEIARRDPVLTMLQARQKELAQSGALTAGGPIGTDALMVLALSAKGIRKMAALSYATGLPAKDCAALLERCVARGLLTPTFRLTPSGAAELDYARKIGEAPARVPQRGSDSYYPRQLRRPVRG